MATDSNESYLLLLLSDSNLPTGGFIASSGLESYSQHGFLPGDSATTRSAGILLYIQKSLHTYATLNFPFVTATHSAVSESLLSSTSSPPVSSSSVFDKIQTIDNLFEAMVLNHVARRASTAQGVALLTLYERAFAREGEDPEDHGRRALVERMRAAVRTGEMHGHLPVGFAVLTAALGLPLGEPVSRGTLSLDYDDAKLTAPSTGSTAGTQRLFLFLHARSLLSSAVRMNHVGPYVSHRLLLHDVRPLVEEALERCRGITLATVAAVEEDEEEGPANTWPLGEILSARHDQLHSKIFNS